MTENQLSRRMTALMNLAKYSTRITLHLPKEFIEEEFNFTETLQESIQCLLKDGRNDVNVLSDYWDDTQIVIDIHVIESEEKMTNKILSDRYSYSFKNGDLE